MKLSDRIKSITYFKANASTVLDDLREPWVITQNGEAKAVVQDVAEYERTQETVALLKMLAIGRAEASAGKTASAREIVARLRDKTAQQ